MDIWDILVSSLVLSLVSRLVSSAILLLSITFEILYLYLFETVRVIELLKLYGLLGPVLYLFGNRNTWRLQAQVLGYLKDEDAFAFKKSVRDECAMISVAVRTYVCWWTLHILTLL
jgi:hypothetical protein